MNTSIKSVHGRSLLKNIAGIVKFILSVTGMTLTQSPQMVIVITSMVVTGLVQTVDTDQLEYITHVGLSQDLQAHLNHRCVTMSSK